MLLKARWGARRAGRSLPSRPRGHHGHHTNQQEGAAVRVHTLRTAGSRRGFRFCDRLNERDANHSGASVVLGIAVRDPGGRVSVRHRCAVHKGEFIERSPRRRVCNRRDRLTDPIHRRARAHRSRRASTFRRCTIWCSTSSISMRTITRSFLGWSLALSSARFSSRLRAGTSARSSSSPITRGGSS